MEHPGGSQGRFRETGLFVLVLTAWATGSVFLSSLLLGDALARLDTGLQYLVVTGMELILFAPAVVWMIVRRVRPARLFGRGGAAQVVPAAFLGILLAPVSIALSAVTATIVSLTGGTLPVGGTPEPETALQALAAFAALCVAAPFAEEAAYRGIVLGGQSGTVRAGVAVLLTALAFTLQHGQFIGVPAILAVGLVITWLAWHSGSLWPSVAAHAAYNGSMLLVMLLRQAMLKSFPVAGFAMLPPPMPSPMPEYAMMAGALIWCVIAVPFAGAVAAVICVYYRHTPKAPRIRPERAARPGIRHAWPWAAAFLLLSAYVALDVLRIYGIIDITIR